ncbi:MAG: PQQ-binding-like beta-propeller repeat protein, partial [Clostridia bacterium]|nr:PQQ-binding-like beta-propeller repeat protein [Clostridia bacterium]
SNKNGKYWLGIEDSAVIWRGNAIFTDNGGHMICLDLNTYEVAWVQDTLDDTNCTPVLALEGEDHHPYVYTSTSFHGGWREPMDAKADIPIWKIDAVTGEIVDGWPIVYQCGTSDGVSGGVQGTMAIGEHSLEHLIFVPVARTPSNSRGLTVAIDRNTGEEVWRFEMERYPWSSPVAVYDENGKGYIIQCNGAGNMFLLDGLTGELLDTITLNGNIEASPAIFNNTIVVGTRSNAIYGITLK